MKSLKSYIKEQNKLYTNTIMPLKDIYFDAIYFDFLESDRTPILEALFQKIPGVKKYGYRIDIPFGEQRPGNQKHMHIYVKNNQIFAINADGSAHDGYHNVKIPDEIVPFIKSKGIVVPPNNIIECFSVQEEQNLLCESNSNCMDVFNKIAIVITNESINSTDIICNSKIKDNFNNINLLMIIEKTYLKNILVDINKDFNKLGHKLKTIEIMNDRCFSEKRLNLYIVWS